MITAEVLVNRLKQYLDGQVSLEKLVDWAENAMPSDEPLDESQAEVLGGVIAKLGLADVREFGLTWQDMEGILDHLGYEARVEIQAR